MFSFEDVMRFADFGEHKEGGEFSKNASMVQQVESENINGVNLEMKKRRKRARSIQTKEEVESKRMIHIAVERNRRRLMNEQLRVLRSLMPESYVQRGDQASIIGGAVEFVKELEQLLQCLESQKRLRLFAASEPSTNFSYNMMINILDLDPSHDHHECKSYIADIEVRVLGLDAIIKILSRRTPKQLIKIIEALEELHFKILHTNVSTIEQNILYAFNVKIMGEARHTAEDIANSVLQVVNIIDAKII